MLNTRLIRLRPLSLQNCGLLRWLAGNRLSWQLSADLLLSWGSLLLLLLLLLMRSLQDLRRKLTRNATRHTTGHTGHARERWLALRKLLLMVHMSWWTLGRTLIVLRGKSGVNSAALRPHHSLDLLQAHQFPCLRVLRREWLRLRRSLRNGLLGLETPDVCASLELRNVLGVLVTLVAGSAGLGRLWDGRPLLRGPLARLVEHLLLLQRVLDHGSLPGEVEILANRLLRGRPAAEGVVVEHIVAVVERIAEAVVRLLEVDARWCEMVAGRQAGATYASSSAAPPPSAAKASCCPKPGALAEWPRPWGWVGSKPKKDMVGGARGGSEG